MKIPRNVLENGEIPLAFALFLVLVLSPAVPTVRAQQSNFSPSMAIITLILVAVLVLVSFFIIYIFYYSDNNGNNIQNVPGAHAGLANIAARGRGLDVSVIQGFPTFSFAELKDDKLGRGALECPICLREFEDHEKLTSVPTCHHIFHGGCIDAWLEFHVTCPVCRANLAPLIKHDVKIQVNDNRGL